MTQKQAQLEVTPLPGRILVEEDRPLKMIGSLHVPDKYQKKPSVGVIVAIGKDTDTPLVTGDRVVYNMYSGTAIFVKGMEKALRALAPEECIVTVAPHVEIEETGA